MELDRASFVPLYYQLQEVLKQQIESGVWTQTDRLPSESELADEYGVSRVVVRRALAILADDLQIRRVKGSGTYLVRPKLALQAGGLSRLLATVRPADAAVVSLDLQRVDVEGPTRTILELSGKQKAIRLTSMYLQQNLPLSITYSYFRPEHETWLRKLARVGRPIDPHKVLADYQIHWSGGASEVETSRCGAFEANQFGIPPRSAVFMVLATEYERVDGKRIPLEVARGEYRGDIVKLLTN